jgi:hypothetical protein
MMEILREALAMEFTLRCLRVGAFEKITFSEPLTTRILTEKRTRERH